MVKPCTQRRPNPQWVAAIYNDISTTNFLLHPYNQLSLWLCLFDKESSKAIHISDPSRQSPSRITISNSNSRNYRTWKTQGQPTSRDCLLSRRNPLKLEGACPKQKNPFKLKKGVFAKQKGGEDRETGYFNCLRIYSRWFHFFISVGATLWNFWCRGFNPLRHWVEVFVEGEYLQSIQPAPKYPVADGLLKDFAELYLSVISTVTIVVYQ